MSAHTNITKAYVRGRWRGAYCAALALVAAAFALWMWLTPLQADDLAFQHFFNRMAAGRGHTPGVWLEYARWHGVDSNGRLANYLAPVVTQFVPRWLFALLSGVAVAWICHAVNLLGQWGRERSGRFSLTLMLWLWPVCFVLWPWRDSLTYPDYVLNYLYTTAILMLYVVALLRAAERTMPLWWLVWAIPAALAGGMMHEGLAAPLLGASVVMLLLVKRAPATVWVLIFFLALGTAESALAPGMLRRIGREHSGFSVVGNGVKMLKHCSLLVPLLVAVTVELCRRSTRREMVRLCLEPSFALPLLTSLGGALICFVFDDATPRYGWCTQVFATVCLAALWRRFWWGRGFGVQIAAGAVLSVLTLAMWGGTMVWQRRVAQEDTEIRRDLDASPTGTIYRDVIGKRTMPWWLLRGPTAGAWSGAFQHVCYNMRFPAAHPLAVLPEGMRDFRPVKPLAGDARIMLWHGYTVGERLPDYKPGLEFRLYKLKITTASGRKVSNIAGGYPFTAPDGRKLFFWQIARMPADPVSIDLNDCLQ